MSKYFDDDPDILSNKKKKFGDLEVRMENINSFPEEIRYFIKEGPAGKLSDGIQARVNKIICEPESDNEFGCEALIHDKVGPKGKKIIAKDQVVEISDADEIGIHSENAKLDNGVLYID